MITLPYLINIGYGKMEKKTVIEYFGSPSATSKALGVTRQYVGQWLDRVPMGMAYKIESITGGALKVKHEDYVTSRGRRYGKTRLGVEMMSK